MKNALIGAGVTAAALIGGYALLSDSNSNSGYLRDDNPGETRAFLPSGTSDRDCPDFRTQHEAQSFFIANGGPSSDPHNLDRDGDGRVCETLP